MSPSPRVGAAVLVGALSLFAALALLTGPGTPHVADVGSALGRGPWDAGDVDARVHAIVWQLRIPRMLAVAFVGAALAVAGTASQGLFRNGLADPSVLGVSAGASLTAALAFLIGLDAISVLAVPSAALVGAVVALLALSWIAWRRPVHELLLGGVALSSLFGAGLALALNAAASRHDVAPKLVHWLLGTFEGRGWSHVAAATPAIAIGIAVVLSRRRDLDALIAGEDTAASLGVDLLATRRALLGAIALLMAAAAATAGTIGFVGLIVPHMTRRVVGPFHRALVPFSALVGATLLLAVDVIVRASPGGGPPPGAITSFLGAPVFLWILRQTQGDKR